MSDPNPKPAQVLAAPRGEVRFYAYVAPEQLEVWDLDPGIGDFPRYRSILTSKEGLMSQARTPQANLCLAVHEERNIVGYCVRKPPAADERWARLEPPIMFEVFAENARGWRGMGLMKPMLQIVCGEEANQDRILYIVGYSWHWDLDETGKTLQEYRDTIIHLLQPFGFRQYPTNEPNVSIRPENLFMARVGDRVDKTTRKRFTNLLFGIRED
jgi:acetoin utilization protein AcuA